MKKLIKLAKELNEVMVLNPPIETNPDKTDEDKLTALIQEAADMFNDEDEEALSDAAITQLKKMGIWIVRDEKEEEKKVSDPAPEMEEEVLDSDDAVKIVKKAKPAAKKEAKKIPINKEKAASKPRPTKPEAKTPVKKSVEKKEKTALTKKQLFLQEIKNSGKKGITMKEIKECDWNTSNGTFYEYLKKLVSNKEMKLIDGNKIVKI